MAARWGERPFHTTHLVPNIVQSVVLLFLLFPVIHSGDLRCGGGGEPNDPVCLGKQDNLAGKLTRIQ